MAWLAAWVAMPSVTVAESAFWRTLALISCRLAVVSSTPAACCEAECARLCEVWLTCSLAELSCCAAERTSAMVPLMVSISSLNLLHRLAWNSLLPSVPMRWVKSPWVAASTVALISSAVRWAISASAWVSAMRWASCCWRSRRLSCIWLKRCSSWAASSLPRSSIWKFRSPLATALAASTAWPRGRVTDRVMATPSSRASRPRPARAASKVARVTWVLWMRSCSRSSSAWVVAASVRVWASTAAVPALKKSPAAGSAPVRSIRPLRVSLTKLSTSVFLAARVLASDCFTVSLSAMALSICAAARPFR